MMISTPTLPQKRPGRSTTHHPFEVTPFQRKTSWNRPGALWLQCRWD